MEGVLPGIVFVVSMIVMIKGADWFLDSAEKIGRALGMSAFIIGAVIIGLGTSFPELLVAIFAMLKGETEIVVANAVGSNVTNILLIIGVAALIARRMVVSKNLIDFDLPILAISTTIFVGVIFDGKVTFWEAVILIITYGIYFFSTIFFKEDVPESEDIKAEYKEREEKEKEKISMKIIVILLAGLVGLLLGAKFLIDSVIDLSVIYDISPAIISITAVAIGTSLPELIVSMKAARAGKAELAIGNIFGSNSFNALIVVGVPALFATVAVDEATLKIGMPVMIAATLLFVITGISRRIYAWEGAMFVMLYVLFIGKLFGLF